MLGLGFVRVRVVRVRVRVRIDVFVVPDNITPTDPLFDVYFV